MESRRLRTGQRGLSTPKRSSSSSARTQNGGGRGSRKRDDRASGGGGGATITTTTTTTNREEGTVDGLLESFQDRSEADSHTALSSLLPTTVLNPAQVRANAPRASLPTTAGTGGGGATASNASHKKNEDAAAAAAAATAPPRPKDLDEYTVETNRPIDSVYIYPSAPQNTNHRQRRQYRSGLRSVSGNSSAGGGSIGATSFGHGSHFSNGSVGGILETLGLGGASSAGDMSSTDEPRSSSLIDDSLVRGNHRRLPHKNRRYGGSNHHHNSSSVHTRAALVLFGLMAVIYGAFQWIAMAKVRSHNQHTVASMRGRNKAKRSRSRGYRAFDEGEDRPVAKELLGKISSSAGSTTTTRAASTSKPKDETTTKPALYAEKPAALPQESAPLDSLESIDRAEEAEKTSLSLAVQSGLAGVYTKDDKGRDIPFLWYIPRSGGGMVKNILSNCKELTVASEVGATVQKNKDEPKLEIVTVGGHKYVNVDTTTEHGIAEAKALGLASSRLANLIVSPRFQEGASLFSSSNQGRAFAMLRHPVERAVSMFYFLKKHNVAAVANMELEEYCKSPHVENNWMTRILTDQMTGDVGDTELEIAKRVLKEKIVVGLLEQKEESMRRFEFYYHWRYDENPTRQNACRTRILVGDYRTNESAKGKVKEGSQAWSLLTWQNKYDLKLYKYAKALFLQQGAELFADMP